MRDLPNHAGGLTLVSAFLLGTMAQADVTLSVREAVTQFEDRCPLVLSDPAAYLSALRARHPPDRIAANSPDIQILQVTDATLPVMEFAEVAVVGRMQMRYCSVALIEPRALASQTAVNNAFVAHLDGRGDLSVVGGRMTASKDELAAHRGTDNDLSMLMPIFTYYVQGLAPVDGSVVKVTIQGGSLEIEAHRILRDGVN